MTDDEASRIVALSMAMSPDWRMTWAVKESYRLGWEARGKRDEEVCVKLSEQYDNEADRDDDYGAGLERGARECADAIARDGNAISHPQ